MGEVYVSYPGTDSPIDQGGIMAITNRALLAMSVVLVFTFVGVHAQQTMGTISGVVQDETGGVLPGVEVTARNTETETTRTVISDDEIGRAHV